MKIIFIIILIFVQVNFAKANQLIHFVKQGYQEQVKTLLKSGINPNLVDEIGNTALMYAILNKNLNLVKNLLQYKANPNHKNIANTTPLHLAIRSKNNTIAELLIKHKAKDSIDFEGNTALMKAVYTRNIDGINLLLKNNPKKLFLKNREENDAFDIALAINDPIIMQLLIKKLDHKNTIYLEFLYKKSLDLEYTETSQVIKNHINSLSQTAYISNKRLVISSQTFKQARSILPSSKTISLLSFTPKKKIYLTADNFSKESKEIFYLLKNNIIKISSKQWQEKEIAMITSFSAKEKKVTPSLSVAETAPLLLFSPKKKTYLTTDNVSKESKNFIYSLKNNIIKISSKQWQEKEIAMVRSFSAKEKKVTPSLSVAETASLLLFLPKKKTYLTTDNVSKESKNFIYSLKNNIIKISSKQWQEKEIAMVRSFSAKEKKVTPSLSVAETASLLLFLPKKKTYLTANNLSKKSKKDLYALKNNIIKINSKQWQEKEIAMITLFLAKEKKITPSLSVADTDSLLLFSPKKKTYLTADNLSKEPKETLYTLKNNITKISSKQWQGKENIIIASFIPKEKTIRILSNKQASNSLLSPSIKEQYITAKEKKTLLNPPEKSTITHIKKTLSLAEIRINEWKIDPNRIPISLVLREKMGNDLMLNRKFRHPNTKAEIVAKSNTTRAIYKAKKIAKTTQSSISKNRSYIQIGIFANYNNVINMEKIGKKYGPVSIRRFNFKGKKLNKVLIGPVSYKTAISMRKNKNFTESFGSNTVIIRK